MNDDSLLSRLAKLGLGDEEAFRSEAFSRNIGIITLQEQEKLRHSKIAIAGLGGVGGSHLITLVRLGVGNFNLADFDVFEPANVNRQYGARVPDFGRPKLEVMAEEAARVNPFVRLTSFAGGVIAEDIDKFLEGVDVVLDGLDFFNFETRRLLFNRSREMGAYVVTAGPLGFSSALLIFSPHDGMNFDEYFAIREEMTQEEKLLAFGVGLAPAGLHIPYMDFSKVSLSSKAGPSLAVACQLCSAMAATEALRIILKRGRIKAAPHYFQFDPYRQRYRAGRLWWGNRNPLQRAKMFYVRKFLLTKQVRSGVTPPEMPKVKISGGKVSEEIVRYIVEAGIHAPSGDNAQPWKFSWGENKIYLYLDPDADRSFFNVRQIASIISCGAVLENMRIAATAFGLEGKVTHVPATNRPELMAVLELEATGCRKDPLDDFIYQRCTNRKPYEKKPAPEDLFDALASQVSRFQGVKLHLLREKADLKKLARIIYKVDRIRTEYRPLHEHLHSMIRFTEEEARDRKDGFPLKNLEAGVAGELFLKWTRPWPVMNAANHIGLGRMVALHSYQAMRSASAAALITVSGTDAKDFLRGGQALERVWLYLAQQGISMQPMTAITLFRLRWVLEGSESFSPKHQALLKNVWDDYQRLFPEMRPFEDGQVMLFRLGYGETIRHTTYRKDLGSFLLQAKSD